MSEHIIHLIYVMYLHICTHIPEFTLTPTCFEHVLFGPGNDLYVRMLQLYPEEVTEVGTYIFTPSQCGTAPKLLGSQAPKLLSS